MKPLLSFLSIFFIFSFSSFSQELSRIKGVVKTEQGNADAATVNLLRDSLLIKVAVTDKNGNYEFENINPGTYKLSVSLTGFESSASSSFAVNGETIKEIPVIQLNPSASTLSSVTVQARKPLVEFKIDKMVVNVDAAPTNAGTTAMEVLEKSPGVSVDRDGNISLKGKQGVIVLLDGKQTYLGGQDLANLLRSMPSSQLDQIEIMTQPSAKFDASGNSGIINLRTKKNTQKGLNGSINLSYVQGRYYKSPNSLNFNYKTGKINLFTSVGYSYWTNFNEQTLLRKFRNSSGDLVSVFDQNNFSFNCNKNLSSRIGVDYSINKTTSIGFQVNGIYNPRSNRNKSRSDIYNGNAVLDSFNLASNQTSDKWKNYGGNLNFRKVLSSNGKEISADVDHIVYRSRNQQKSVNLNMLDETTMNGNPFLLNGDLPSNITIYSGKIDYVHPLSTDAKMEFGGKTSYVETDNNALYTTYDHANTKWIADNTRSNHFIYRENIFAVYANYSRKIKKWGIQGGLRMENTDAKGNQLGNALQKDTSFKKNYSKFFPTAFVSFSLNDKNNFGLSYGRRIERPNYQDMNPFQYFLDQYTYRQGNPNLNPQFTHNIELSHNFKSVLNSTLSYSRTSDILNDILKQNDLTKVTYQTKENVARRSTLGLAVSFNKNLTKFWTSNIYVNVNNSHYEGIVNDTKLDVSLISFMGHTTQVFRFAKTWSAEVNGFYRTRAQETGMFLIEPMGVISFGISKQIFRNKGTLKINAIDPFYIQRAKVIIDLGNIDALVNNQWDNRRVAVSFSYRFSKGQNVQQQRKTGSSVEEQNRVGGSGN
jgi:outer membrane receptor protein involved in Fe transport